MATFWALLNGESEIGTTLHFIDDASIDTGRIVGSTRLRVDSRRSYLWHVLSLYEEGCEQLVHAASVSLRHPRTGEPLVIEAPEPASWASIGG